MQHFYRAWAPWVAFCLVPRPAACDVIVNGIVVKPNADFSDHEESGLVLIENVGHVATWRYVQVVPQEHVPLVTGGFSLCHYTGRRGPEIRRCRAHTRASLFDTYTVVTNISSLDRFFPEGHVMIVFDDPMMLQYPTDDIFTMFKSVGDSHHLLAGSRALERQYGQNAYPFCAQVCSPNQCLHRHVLNITWVLEPLWGEQLPPRISFVNIGCRDFGPEDPLFSLLDTGSLLVGLCIDKNGVQLSTARERLHGHKVEIIELAVTPTNIGRYLREHLIVGPLDGPLDILQVDIDCFDVDVLDVALSVVQANVVIMEVVHGVPPPFRFAVHYAESYRLDEHYTNGTPPALFGASLSYLVDMLARKGFWLYKFNHDVAIFVHQRVAARFTDALDSRVQFPVDEWSCYMDFMFTREFRYQGEWTSYMHEWFLDPDLYRAFGHIWRNLSSFNKHVGLPFTLDIEIGRAHV